CREISSYFAGQFGGALVDLVHLVGEIEFAEHDTRAAEGVGLDYIGAGLEVSGVNVFNDVGTAKDQNFRAVLFAPEIVERRVALLNLSGDRGVINDDAFANCLQKGFHLLKSRPLRLSS